MRGLRAIRTALLLAAVLTLGPVPAAVHAAGPGVRLYTKNRPQPTVLPGGLFAGGVSILTLVSRAGIDPAAIKEVTVTRARGDQILLQRADLATARLSDDGRTTRFSRGGSASPEDVVEATTASGPLEIAVDGGADLVVEVSANPARVDAGRTVRFTATVRKPAGAQLSYDWDFGDGDTDSFSGARPTHVYADSGSRQVVVSVRNLDPGCATGCGGTGIVDVEVGDPPDEPKAPEPTPGAGTGDPTAPGSATGTGGGGQGGSGGGSGSGDGSGTQPEAVPGGERQREKKPPPPPAKPFGVTISGVLINDTGVPVRTLPTGTPAGAPKGVQATRGGDSERALPIGLSGLLALAVISLGALRERRGVRLRVA